MLGIAELAGDARHTLAVAAGLSGLCRFFLLVCRGSGRGRGRRKGQTRQVVRGKIKSQAVLDLTHVIAAHAFEKIAGRLIAFGGMPGYRNPGKPALLGQLPQARQHLMFDAPAQYAAAQEEGIYCQGTGSCFGHDRAHQTVVAEPVADLDSEAVPALGFREDTHLALGAPDRGEIELVRAVRQLGNARQLFFVHGRHVDL